MRAIGLDHRSPLMGSGPLQQLCLPLWAFGEASTSAVEQDGQLPLRPMASAAGAGDSTTPDSASYAFR